MRVTSVSAVLSLGLDVMKRDISETTRCRHYYVLLCIMYGTLHPRVRAGMPAAQGHERLYSVCDCAFFFVLEFEICTFAAKHIKTNNLFNLSTIRSLVSIHITFDSVEITMLVAMLCL